jgi:thioredoxin-related protein
MKISKFLKVIFFTIFLSTILHAQELKWLHSYKEAVDVAKKENKKIYLLITTKSCPWCRKLENETLKDQFVVEKLNSSYIAVEMTRGEGDYPVDTLKAKMVPMNYFLDANETIIHQTPGFWEVEDFLSILDDVQRKSKSVKN